MARTFSRNGLFHISYLVLTVLLLGTSTFPVQFVWIESRAPLSVWVKADNGDTSIYLCDPAPTAAVKIGTWNVASDTSDGGNPSHSKAQYETQLQGCKVGLEASAIMEVSTMEFTTIDQTAIFTQVKAEYAKKKWIAFVCSSYRALEDALFDLGKWAGPTDTLDFSPRMSSDKWRYWRQWNLIMWGNPSQALETVLLVRYAMTVLRISRIAAMSMKDFTHSAAMLQVIGGTAGMQVLTFNPGDPDSKLLDYSPQMIIVYGASYLVESGIMGTMVTSVKTINTVIAIPNDSYGLVELNVNKAFAANGFPAGYNQRFLVTTTNALAKETQHKYIVDFNSQWRLFSGPALNSDSPSDQIFSVAGWLQGRLAATVMEAPQSRCTDGLPLRILLWYGPETYKTWPHFGGGFGYNIADYHIGGFAAAPLSCNSDSCHCNQGGRVVWLYEVMVDQRNKKLNKISNANYSIATSDAECYYDPSTFYQFGTVSVLYAKENAELGVIKVPLSFLERVVSNMAIPTSTEIKTPREFSLGSAEVDDTTDWTQLLADSPAQIYIGAGVPGMDLSGRMALNLISTVGAQPEPATFDEFSIRVTPTLQQGVYDCYGMLLTNAPDVGPDDVYLAKFKGKVRFFYKNVAKEALSALAKGAAKEWLQDEPEESFELSALEAQLSKDGVNFVVGGMGSETLIMNLLDKNPDAFVFLPWEDYIQMYPALQVACGPVSLSARNRLLTSTNLPQGGDMSQYAESKSPLLKAFHKITKTTTENQSPAYMTFFAMAQVLRWTMLASDSDLSATTLVNTLYNTQSVEVLGLLLEFKKDACPTQLDVGGQVPCYGQRSWGATSRHLVSIIQVWAPTTANVFPAVVMNTLTTAPPPIQGRVSTTSTSSTSSTTTTTLEPSTTQPPPPNTTVLPTEPPMINKMGRAAIYFSIAMVGSLLALLLWCCCAFASCCVKDTSAPLDCRYPVTCAVFHYGRMATEILEREGSKAAVNAIETLENVIMDSIYYHNLHVIERQGSMTAVVSHNVNAVLQCCMEVREAAVLLGAMDVAGVAAERAERRLQLREEEGRPPVDRRQSVDSLPSIQIFGPTNVNLSCKRSEVMRTEGVPYAASPEKGSRSGARDQQRTAEAQRARPGVTHVSRRRESSVVVPHNLNAVLPRVAIGVATSLMVMMKVRGVLQPMWRGRCLTLARLIATQKCTDQIFLSGSTWLSLSDAELRRVNCTSSHRSVLTQASVLSHYCTINEDMTLYEVTPMDHCGLRQCGGKPQSMSASIRTYINRFPRSRRIPKLEAVLRSWGVPEPPRPPNTADDAYAEVLLRCLEMDSRFATANRQRSAATDSSTRLTSEEKN